MRVKRSGLLIRATSRCSGLMCKVRQKNKPQHDTYSLVVDRTPSSVGRLTRLGACLTSLRAQALQGLGSKAKP